MNANCQRFSRRLGVTLIELMIVMGLMIVLASISLGAMKALLRGQKVSQASVIVRQYLQNAQTRSIASGRPVAVFLDRISLAGGATGEPLSANFTVTRLQLGEVFPPYTGDFENALGLLQSTLANGYADAIFFENAPNVPNVLSNVTSGIGSLAGNNYVPGFVSAGDVLEIEGCSASFSITQIRAIPPSGTSPGGLTVVFANQALSAPQFPAGNQIPLSGRPNYRKFRIYRQPSKSLAGAVVLPRGTCIDLSLSGVGVNDSAIEGGTFGLDRAPLFLGETRPFNMSKVNNPGNFSRVGIVFNSDGRIAYLLREDSVNGAQFRNFLDGSSQIYLLVGRSDQVLPGFPANANDFLQSARLAALQHPEFGTGDLPKSNFVDPENVWITCNPVTGEVKSSPMVSIDDPIIATRYGNPAVSIVDLVMQTRSLAAAGMSN